MAWNAEVLRWLKTIGTNGAGAVDTSPLLTQGNTNTANTVTQLQTANTNLNTVNTSLGAINTTSAATNTALGTTNSSLTTINTSLGAVNTTSAATNTLLGTTNSSLATLNANTALVAWQENGLKSGTLYIAARYQAGVGAGNNIDTIVTVGSKPVLLYSRNISTTGSSVNSTIFVGPTYTGGTAGTVYSTNRVTAVSPTLGFLTGATITATGTQIVPTSYMLSGSGGLLGGNTGGAGAIGAPIYLPASTTYLFRVTNSDTTSSNVYAQILFYEGVI